MTSTYIVPLLLLAACSGARAVTVITDVDVVIVGAGAAGMAAAHELLALSNLTVAVLEGRRYTGGRVHARPFGDRQHPVVIEEGANWVHGEPPPGGRGRFENPAWRLARTAGLSTIRIPGSCANTSGYALFHSDGTCASPTGGLPQRRADAAFACANATGQRLRAGEDISFADALKHCGFAQPTTGSVEDTLYWEVSAANLPMAIDRESLKWSLPDATYQYYGPDDHFVYEQRPRGYATALDALFDGTRLQRRWDASLRLDTAVVEIAAAPHGAGRCASVRRPGRDAALVRTKDGRRFCAGHVISTLPLGVLKADHASLFTSPPLSPSKVHGLNAFDMGNFTKLHIAFEKNFWRARGSQWLVAERDGDNEVGRRDPMEFHDIDALVPGSKTLFTYVSGPDCPYWETMTDAEASAALVRLLQRHFPNTTMPRVTAFHMTRHGFDPFMRGAYSVTKVGVTDAAFNAMVEPHGDNVFFAGEHTCAAFNGYVHGGILSGRRAAAEVLLARDLPAEAEKAYDWSCELLRPGHRKKS